jgi:LysM repeat protein
MGLFDRRKDAKPEQQQEPATPPAPPADGPTPVAAEVKETRSREELEVAAAPPSPPAPHAAEPASEPEAPEAPPAAGTRREIHTVGAGETIADLTERYGVPAEEIARQNHLPASGQIHPGQVLVITRKR